MLSWFFAVLQFVLQASDPNWSCVLSHREPGVAATFYLYCSQMTPDGIEVASVGRFIPDAKAEEK